EIEEWKIFGLVIDEKKILETEEKLYSNDFKSANIILKNIEKEFKEFGKKLSKDWVNETKELIDEWEKKKIGRKILVNIKYEFESGKNDVKEKRYRSALSCLKKIKENIGLIGEKYRHAMESIETSESLILEGRDIGIDVSAASNKLNIAKKAFEDEEYDNAINLANEAMNEIRLARKEYDSVVELAHQLEAIADRFRKIGIETTLIQGYLDEGKDFINEKNYGIAKDVFERGIKESERVERDYLVERLLPIDALIAEGERIGADVSSPAKLVDEAKRAMMAGDNAKALVLANEADEALKKVIETHKNAIGQIENLNKKIEEAKNIGIDVNKLLSSLQDVKKKVSAHEYESANIYLKECEEELARLMDAEKEFIGMIKKIEENLSVGKEIGVDVEKFFSMLDDVKNKRIDAKKFSEEIKLCLDGYLQNEIENVEKVIIQAEYYFLDEKIRELFEDSWHRLEEEDYKTAHLNITSAKTMAEEIIDGYSKAKDGLIFLRGKIEEGKFFGIDTSSIVSLYQQINSKADEGRIKEANALLSSLPKIENEFVNVLSKEILKLNNSIEFLREKGGRHPKAEYRLKIAENAVECMDYKVMADAIEDGLLMTSSAEKKYEEMRYIDKDIEKTIEQLERIRLDATIVEELRARAKSCLLSGDYEKALELSKKAVEEAENTIKNSVFEALKILSNRIDLISRLGGNVAKPRSLFLRAKERIERKEYIEVYEIVGDALEECDRAIAVLFGELTASARAVIKNMKEIGLDTGEVESSVETATEIFKEDEEGAIKLLKDCLADSNKLIYRKIADGISLREGELIEMERIGATVKKLEERLNEARKGLDERNYIKAKRRLDELDTEIKKMRIDIFGKEFKRCDGIIRDGIELGLDFSKYEEMFIDAKKHYDENEFGFAFDFSRRICEEGEKEIERYAEELKKNNELLIDSAKEVDIKISDIEKLFKEGSGLLEKGEHIKAIKIFRTALDNCKLTIMKDVDISLSKLDKEIKESSSIGIAEGAEELENAKKEYEAKNYISAKKILIPAIKKVLEKKQKQIKDTIDLGMSSINEAISLGCDTKNVASILEKMKKSIEGGEEMESYKLSKALIDECNKIKSEFVKGKFEIANDIIERAEKLGADVGDAKRFLEESKNAIDASNYSLALEKALSAGDFGEKAILELIEDAIGYCEEDINEAKELGCDVKSIEACLKDAKKLLEDKEYNKAYTLVITLLDDIENTEKAKALETTKLVDERIELCEGIGVSITNFLILKEKIVDEMEKEEYSTAIKKSSDCLVEIEKAISEKATNEIGIAEDKIERCLNLGFDTSIYKDETKTARELLDKKEYVLAMEKIEKVKKICDEKMTGIAEDENQLLLSLISEAEEIGADVADARSNADEAVKLRENREYENALGKSRDGIEICKNKIAEIIDEEITLCNSEIGECEGFGCNVEGIKERLKIAKINLAKAEYKMTHSELLSLID
ncbi:MAG: hypothetical protein AB1779_08650, partial [Candidatus Thermoplasmatota archaeon]